MSSSIRRAYERRVADACPECEEGEGVLQRTSGARLPYVECSECTESIDVVRGGLKWERYEKALRRWNLAVAESRDERQWRMTGRERHRKRTEPREEHEAGPHPTLE